MRARKIDLLCESVIKPNPNQSFHIEDIEREILNHEKPNDWNVHNEENMERKLEVDFYKYAALIKSETGLNLKETMAFEF